MFMTFAPRRHVVPFGSRMFREPSLLDMDLDLDIDDIVSPVRLVSLLSSPGQERCLKRKSKDDESLNNAERQKRGRFEMSVDVQGFSPEELTVKLVDDKTLVVRGHHEKKDDSGMSYRQMSRSLIVPDDVQLEQLTCELDTKRATMTLSAPRKLPELAPQPKEIVIPIKLQSDKEESRLKNTQGDAEKTNGNLQKADDEGKKSQKGGDSELGAEKLKEKQATTDAA